jgi:pyruvate carboxylase subunit B
MKYFVTVDGREYEVSVNGDTVTFEGVSHRAAIEDVGGGPVSLLRIDNEVHELIAVRGESRFEHAISVGGWRFRIEALNERARIIRELSSKAAGAAGPAPVVAPMPGLIVRVNVQPGDQVRAGQGVVIMEAMKMENELRTTAAGTVKGVRVTPGAAVEKGTLLVELE